MRQTGVILPTNLTNLRFFIHIKNNMPTIKINVAIYGKLAKLAGGKHIAIQDLEVDFGNTLGDLLEMLKIPMEETSFIFLDAVLCDVPGLTIVHDEPLKDGSHVGIFSTGYMWPYQYRDGMPMSPPLTAAMKKYGAMHHTYTKINQEN
jgi:molybdopterin converting factor small subunit